MDLYTNDFKVLVLADFVFYRKKKFKLTVNKKKRWLEKNVWKMNRKRKQKEVKDEEMKEGKRKAWKKRNLERNEDEKEKKIWKDIKGKKSKEIWKEWKR